MSADTSVLVPSRARGWRMGLRNMLAKELGAWWRTRRWWMQCLIALLLLNGTLALNLKDGGRVDNAGMNFLVMAALCVPFAAISLAQDSILGEGHSGTAAWVLSKPLRRPAFILAKLIANGLGLLGRGSCSRVPLPTSSSRLLAGVNCHRQGLAGRRRWDCTTSTSSST